MPNQLLHVFLYDASWRNEGEKKKKETKERVEAQVESSGNLIQWLLDYDDDQCIDVK